MHDDDVIYAGNGGGRQPVSTVDRVVADVRRNNSVCRDNRSLVQWISTGASLADGAHHPDVDDLRDRLHLRQPLRRHLLSVPRRSMLLAYRRSNNGTEYLLGSLHTYSVREGSIGGSGCDEGSNYIGRLVCRLSVCLPRVRCRKPGSPAVARMADRTAPVAKLTLILPGPRE